MAGELDLGDQTCEAVFEGVEENPGMNVKNMTLKAGFWRTSYNSTEVLACLREEHCLGGSNLELQCAIGHTGPLCAVCEEGYASAGTGANMKCVVCDGDATASILVYVSIFISVFSGGVVATCCCGNIIRKRGGEEGGEGEVGEER